MKAGAELTVASYDLNNCELRLRLQRCCSAGVSSWDCCRLVKSGRGTNRRYDLNADNVINAADVTLARRVFARHRYGEDGVVDQRDIDALRACFGGTAPVPGVHPLHDLDGDGDVDYADQVILHGLLTVAVSPDLDVNRDGRVTVADAYAHAAQPIDVNRDGVIDAVDGVTLQASLRASESTDLASPRP